MKAEIALFNPKYPHNVGGAIRACSCWGLEKLIWSGKRVPHPEEWAESELQEFRIPREERMKGYSEVQLIRSDNFKKIISQNDVIPICVELAVGTENLFDFEHPDNALYIFGPEDGSIPGTIKQHCHRFIQIPTRHCLNLACAINVVLGHRSHQIYMNTGRCEELTEHRGSL